MSPPRSARRPLERERTFVERDAAAPYADYCPDAEAGALDQMQNAVRLPIAVRGALMPDAHLGYGLPIGGVLATENTVIPYAVGVDIACRMKLSVLRHAGRRRSTATRRPLRARCSARDRLRHRRRAPKSDRIDHDGAGRGLGADAASPRDLREGAAAQLGTRGSGNHFVEFGDAHARAARPRPRAPASTSRCSPTAARAGPARRSPATTRKLARDLHPELPPELTHLAWLDLDSDAGPGVLGRDEPDGRVRRRQPRGDPPRRSRARSAAKVARGVENHHNFAWKEAARRPRA